MAEIETQNGTVEVEEGDKVSIQFDTNHGRNREMDGVTVSRVQGASFMGYSLAFEEDGAIAHDENIESLEVVN